METRESILPRVPDLFRSRVEAILRAAESHALTYFAALAESAEKAERCRQGAGEATWEQVLNEDPPDCVEEYLRASGWLSDERAVLWRNEHLAPGATVSTMLAFGQQIAADRARLGFVCMNVVPDDAEEEECDCLNYRAEHIGRLREAVDACSFCESREHVAQLHGEKLAICRGCASGAVAVLADD